MWMHIESYCNDLIRNVYNIFKLMKNVAFIQSYYQKEIFRIDGVYSSHLGTPCHYCHMERWLNREIKRVGQNHLSWGNLRSLLKENCMPLPPIGLTSTEREFSRHLIIRSLQELVGNSLVHLHVDTFLSSVSTDLITCIIKREPVIHWYACDCNGD